MVFTFAGAYFYLGCSWSNFAEMAQRVAEMKMRRKLERQQAREAARRNKQLRGTKPINCAICDTLK